ncbi:MAG: DEAD/DEAH box helicase, partial [Chlamydiia bacterium]|nr:DEAD/DEAH box helicase [Chlamydiia bacterium]
MGTLPGFLTPFIAEGNSLFKRGAVTEIEFSGSTYQLHVHDPAHGSPWVFLQLDLSGRVRDHFCTCDAYDDKGACPHLAAAHLRIYEPGPLPLHQVYEATFWNALGHLFFDLFEGMPAEEENALFSVKAATSQAKRLLHALFHERPDETEETSLKFSNLSAEELELWKEGEPSRALSYELSVWSDLAKACFLLQQEKAKAKIEIQGAEEPFLLKAMAGGLEITLKLTKKDLERLIPFWGSVPSSLKAANSTSGEVKSVSYNPDKAEIVIKREVEVEENGHGNEEGIALGKWLYLPKKGFQLLEAAEGAAPEVVPKEQLTHFLTHRARALQRYMRGFSVHQEVLPLQYTLHFDRGFNLHIEAYVHVPGDLKHPHALFLGGWLYLPGEGFFPYEEPPFQAVEKIIRADEVSHFVSKERAFLADKSGFVTHEVQMETLISYSVEVGGTLTFESLLANESDGALCYDFGAWVYIPKDGFYRKSDNFAAGQVRPGMRVKRDAVSIFIQANEEELRAIPHFFTDSPIVLASGLSALVDDKGNVHIDLHHDFAPEYDLKSLEFFDNYIYAPEKGFSKLPIDPRIPERFHHPQTIPAEQFDQFAEYLFPQILPYFFELDPKLRAPKELKLALKRLEKNEDTLSVKVEYVSQRGSIDARAVLEALKNRRRFLLSDAGLLDLTEERFQWLGYLDKKALGSKAKGMTLTPLDLIRADAYDALEVIGEGKKAEELRLTLKNLFEQHEEAPDLDGFNADLRPYQNTGLQWLWHLYRQGLSGLLCDDMGLGKTLQAMALLAAASEMSAHHKHFLVICPTSVIYHWQDKIHQFWPECKVFTFYGSDRSLEGFRGEYDVLLTSYGVYRREQKLLESIDFEIAILDEVQMAKNRRSKLHLAVKTMNAKMRLGLTGTPIENYLSELKALFDLALPGYLPTPTAFRDFFQIPIERLGDPTRKELLSRMIHPFVLRRKKGEVLTDLPEKIEEISHCALLAEQYQLYEETLRKERRQILSSLEDPNEKVPYLHVFTLLMRLKQICNHPALYFKDPENYQNYQSGKWERFTELLEETQEVGQKVVVFSQYLLQLDIIEKYLTERGIGFAGIRGATVRRDEEIKRFHSDPECKVFVASLQAAGLGIDLTPASVVIHYDRWWNAARENQATDRVHRIGQTRGVQVFKL